jgi:hypothetical protein
MRIVSNDLSTTQYDTVRRNLSAAMTFHRLNRDALKQMQKDGHSIPDELLATHIGAFEALQAFYPGQDVESEPEENAPPPVGE